MKKTINITLHIIFCSLLLPELLFAQADLHFSQFYETSILRNPALTGVFANDFKFGLYVRQQWSSISNPYQTELLSAETHMPVSSHNDDFFSLGLIGYVDKAGSISQSTTAGYLAVSYNKSLNKSHPMFLSVGFTGGMLQTNIDPSKATFNNQYQNGVFNPNNPTFEYVPNPKMKMYDVGAGINFNSTSGDHTTYMLGVSGYHFNQSEYSYYGTPGVTENIRWNVNGGLAIDATESINVVLQANYALQGTYKEVIGGGILNWTAQSIGLQKIYVFSLGALYRLNDAIIPVFKIGYMNMSLGISYDVNISTLTDASNMQGGFEVTLFYSGNYGSSNEFKRTMCPRFN